MSAAVSESPTADRPVEPPDLLLDPEGEGVYLLSDLPGILLRAAALFGCEWRDVAHKTVWMRPAADSDEWLPANIGRWPRGWRLNLPKRWRPVAYAYCTPRPNQ